MQRRRRRRDDAVRRSALLQLFSLLRISIHFRLRRQPQFSIEYSPTSRGRTLRQVAQVATRKSQPLRSVDLYYGPITIEIFAFSTRSLAPRSRTPSFSFSEKSSFCSNCERDYVAFVEVRCRFVCAHARMALPCSTLECATGRRRIRGGNTSSSTPYRTSVSTGVGRFQQAPFLRRMRHQVQQGLGRWRSEGAALLQDLW